jgi:hypothetical protein
VRTWPARRRCKSPTSIMHNQLITSVSED